MKHMSDSVKLRFEHRIWCLIFSYLTLIVGVVSIFLIEIVADFFILLVFPCILISILLLALATAHFVDAIEISKEESANNQKSKDIKRTMSKTLD